MLPRGASGTWPAQGYPAAAGAPGTHFEAHGIRELQRAFGGVQSDIGQELKKALEDAAEPVVSDARGRLARYEGAKLSTLRAHSLRNGIVVRQGARKKSGLRPDFGSLQMTEVLIPAVGAHEDDVLRRSQEAVDGVLRGHGFDLGGHW